MQIQEKYRQLDGLKKNMLAGRLTFLTLEEILKTINSFTERKNLQILDIGCGPGFWMELIAQKFPEIKITGIDLQSEWFDDRLTEKYPNVKFVKADALKLSFESGKFDLIYSLDVIEHLKTKEEVNRYLREIGRVLKADGKLIIQTPNRYRLSMRFREIIKKRTWPYFLGRHKVLGEILHYREYGKDDLERTVSKAGFRNIKTELLWLGLTSPVELGITNAPKILEPLSQILFLTGEK